MCTGTIFLTVGLDDYEIQNINSEKLLVSKSRKEILVSSILQKTNLKFLIFPLDYRIEIFHSFFERIENTKMSFRN